MSDKVVNLADRLSQALDAGDGGDTDGMLHEKFLLEEGLDLLAAYRAIANRDVRMSVLSLLQNLARTQSR